MGRDKHERERRDKGRLPPFVPLLIATLDTPAWRALSHGARSLYVGLKRRYSRTATTTVDSSCRSETLRKNSARTTIRSHAGIANSSITASSSCRRPVL